MNRKKNAHYQNTHTSIQQALLTLLEANDLPHVTVRKICEHANINRSTFYTHYSSIEDLLNEVDSLLRIEHLNLFSQAGIRGFEFLHRKGLSIVISYVRSHRHFYRVYIRKMQEIDYLTDYFEDIWEAQIREPFWDTSYSYQEMFYKMLFFMSGSLKIIEYWLHRDCEEPDEEIIDLITELVPKELLSQYTPTL